jgi:hypothetical protein
VGRPEIVLEVPVPVIVPGPGERVRVQVPDAGNPLSTTLPVATAHVGCVIVPTTGAVGVGGCALITTLPDETDIHPSALVTLKEYVFGSNPEIVTEEPLPVVVALSGVRIRIHVPVEGNPVKTTLPVATLHVGWLIVPI